MDAELVRACQFGAWYPAFRDVAFASRIIQLPPAFVEYLVADGVFLPEGSDALPRRAEPAPHDDYEPWDEEACDAADPQLEAAQVPAFPELMREIGAAIDELGGCVAPKLSWSAPHDAVWVSASKSLVCRSADEVLLLLKSSDRIAHDICHAFDACAAAPSPQQQHTLVLRKWVNMRPEREFRCFVAARELVAVSQRNVLEHAPGLAAQRQELLEALLEFFEQAVQPRFPRQDYTFDVYVTSAGRVRLVDFNPVGGTTSPLLFDWEELPYDMHAAHPEQAATSRQEQPPGAADAEAMLAGGGCSGPEAAASTSRGQVEEHECAVSSSTGGSQGQGAEAEEEPHSSNGHEPAGGEILFRLAPPQGRLRPGTAVYGAPFEMADVSEGGAISELLRKLEVQQHEP